MGVKTKGKIGVCDYCQEAIHIGEGGYRKDPMGVLQHVKCAQKAAARKKTAAAKK